MGQLLTELPAKYKTRKEQILKLLAYSGEIPQDLYTFIGISNQNYRQVLSRLRKQNIIRSVKANKITGYVYAAEGKAIAERTIGRAEAGGNDIQRRRRQHNYSYLYSLLDEVNIPYEQDKKPGIETVGASGAELYFYTAQEYKDMHEQRSTTFKGSRFYGYLSGLSKVYPVYMAKTSLPKFNKVEFNMIVQLRRDYYNGGGIEEALLLCRDLSGVSNILNEIIHFETQGQGQSLLASAYFENVILVPMLDRFDLMIWTLYHEKWIRKQIEKANRISPPENTLQYDGMINGTHPLIYMLTISAAKLKYWNISTLAGDES